MCGITGWVSYDRDLTNEHSTLEAMTATMVCRGPDAGGIWLDTHVVLGHRRLAVIDVEGGAQPMVAEVEGRTALVTTYNGEIYNYRELRSELEGRGHRFRTRSDTEVALRAYMEWGDAFAERLNGMYAIALWDPRREELVLVRDRLGIKPLYYSPIGDGIVFGSEPKAILAHPSISAAVDAEGLTELLAITKTPGHAVYRGMRELRPGHLLRVRREGVTERRYWSLEARDHTDDLPTTIGRVRELLDDIVARQLVADVPLCTLLSGGLDSSVIAALAAKALAAESRGALRTFAVDFAGSIDDFKPDALRGTADGPFAQMVAEHVASNHSDIVLDTAQLLDRANRAAVLIARDLPSGLGDIDTSLYLLFKAIRQQFTVALSGEGADELFGGYRHFHDDAIIRTEAFPWIAVFRNGLAANAANARESFLARGLLAKLDIPGYQDARYRDAIAEVPCLAGESGLERRMREISYLHLTRLINVQLDRKDRASMATSLEVRVPFCDHRLIEYVFNAPWSMKTFDGREKSLLRAATRDVLPAAVADRVKSPYPSAQDAGYAEGLREEMRTLLADHDAAVRSLIDVPAATEAVASAPGPDVRNAGEMVLALDQWLRRYQVSLEI